MRGYVGQADDGCARSASWRGIILLNKLDLDSLYAPAKARSARALAVLGPAKPSFVLYMGSIVNVVVLGELVGKPHLDSFDLARFANGARDFTFVLPALPAKVCAMGLVLHRAGVGEGRHVDFERSAGRWHPGWP